MDKVYSLIIYDIVDDKRRNRFAKTMNKYGIRVQKSAFESWVTGSRYRKMLIEIQKIADKNVDSIRVYKLNREVDQVMVGKNPILDRGTQCWV